MMNQTYRKRHPGSTRLFDHGHDLGCDALSSVCSVKSTDSICGKDELGYEK